MEGSKKSENSSKNKTEGNHHNDHHKTSSSPQKQHFRDTKVLTTVMPCYETTRASVQRNGDSLESLLDDYLRHGQVTRRTKDKNHHYKKKPINYEMIEDTLLECLNLTRDPNSLKRMSHTILQYFTQVVFNQIKNNYYKQLSKKRKCSWAKRPESTVLFFNRKYACGYAVCTDSKKNIKETISPFVSWETCDELLPEGEASNETINHPKPEEETPPISPSKEPQLDSDSFTHEMEENSDSVIFSDQSQESEVAITLEDIAKEAFLCNLPNAPPFILKMSKVTASNTLPEDKDKSEEICCSSLSVTSTDVSFDTDDYTNSVSSMLEKKRSTYTKVPDLNMYIDGNCPGFEVKEFKDFVTKSITWIKADGQKKLREDGIYMSTPTICLTGLTSMSNNPFSADEIDSRRPGKNSGSSPNSDMLSNQNSYHLHSKIPRMLHPGKCKVHAMMKNVQLSPGSKGCAANKASTCGGCPADKTDIQINPYVKVSVSTTCPSLTNASSSSKQGSKSKNANIQASQSSMGDCMKGIKSDPGCYCGNEPVEPTPCPIRLREDCECVDEEEPAGEQEEEEALCYCPPGEQPLLLKKSNVECDCANRRRCEDETLVEPPKEKPDVFWALTKVSLLKDGTKNFEIIDVSPVPPGYYLMPDVNNLVLVGPQPKPAKAAPSKNCCCK